MFHHNTADSRPAIKATTDLPDENALLIASGIQIRCRRSHSTLNRLFGSLIPREGGQPTRRGYGPSRRTCQTDGHHTHVTSQPRRRGRRRNETIGRGRPERRRHDPRGGARDDRVSWLVTRDLCGGQVTERASQTFEDAMQRRTPAQAIITRLRGCPRPPMRCRSSSALTCTPKSAPSSRASPRHPRRTAALRQSEHLPYSRQVTW
jgi:hypothetical protein